MESTGWNRGIKVKQCHHKQNYELSQARCMKEVPMPHLCAEGHKLVPTKNMFLFKHKQNGTKQYQARIVTEDFLMIPGVDYMESSPQS